MVSISVVMPALNEETALFRAVNDVLFSFNSLNLRGEVIIVNDGSLDRTGEIADEMSRRHSNVRVIHHEKPHGIGASFWEGCHAAENDAVTMLPGDGENESYEILRYLPLMEHVDLIVPYVYNREIRSFSRRLISKVYKGIINLSFGMLLNYMNGTVIYRKNVLLSLQLKSRGFFYQTELLIRAIYEGYLYAEVPYKLSQRNVGKSKALTLSSLLKVSRDYLSVVRFVYARSRSSHSFVPGSVTAERRGRSAQQYEPRFEPRRVPVISVPSEA